MPTVKFNLNINDIKEKSMSNELVVKQKVDVAKEHDLSIIEQVVMQGDLAKLNPEQRVTYYHKVCESIGLNPYTRPFDYISLNGKLTLYAKKDATEQLRKVNNISIVELEGKMIDDLYIVVAKAKTADGRLDQATGAVSLGHLKGEQRANAIMKAETKAKRRVTLSIAGMGWTDESEVQDIPNAATIEVDVETGEIKKQQPDPKPEPIKEMISEEEAAEFMAEFDKCSPEYKRSILNAFTKKGYTPERFPLEMFEKALAGAKTKAMEYQEQIKQRAEELQKAKDGE